MTEYIRADVIGRLREMDIRSLSADEVGFFKQVRPCEWDLYFALLDARLDEQAKALELARRIIRFAIVDTPAMHLYGSPETDDHRDSSCEDR